MCFPLPRYPSHKRHDSQGFTLIESIIAMVLLGFAMVTLVSFLYPQVERSAVPHYQVRAANLQQGLMTRILALDFDQQSSRNGGRFRCEERNKSCTAANQLGPDSGETPSEFNDVDDFIGCWWSDSAADCGSEPIAGQLTTLLETNSQAQYAHFTITIAVQYIDETGAVSNEVTNLKRVRLVINTGRYGEYTLFGFRGNY